MERLEAAYAEKILANVTGLIELDDADAALLLRQCSIELLKDGKKWHINLLSCSEIYKVLQEDCSIRDVINRGFGVIALSAGVNDVSVRSLPEIEEFSSSWRQELPRGSTLTKQILESAVQFLLQGQEEGDRNAADLLRECNLTKYESFTDGGDLSCVELDLSCPRRAYDIFCDDNHKLTQAMKRGVTAVLPNRYQQAWVGIQFRVRGQTVLIVGEESPALNTDETSHAIISKLTWSDILVSQQGDFIRRLAKGQNQLLNCDVRGLNGELTVIPSSRTKELRDFCWDMTNKFKGSPDIKKVFTNNLKGKLGEEALSVILGDRITEVDYEVKRKGDGKIDFKLKSCPDVGIQVKARNGEPNQVDWSISLEEIKANKVIVCFLIQEEVSEAQSEYHIISAGFIPTDQIEIAPSADRYSIAMPDLYYFGGLRGYLDYLGQQELFRQSSASSQTSSKLVPEYSGNLEEVWQAVVNALEPPGTQALFRAQGYLLHLDQETARISLVSRPLFRLAQERLANLEAAFLKVMGHHMKISIEVVSYQSTSEVKPLIADPPKPDTNAWKVGDRAVHETFGEGVVTHLFGKDKTICLAVKFPQVGRKIIDLKFTSLQRIK